MVKKLPLTIVTAILNEEKLLPNFLRHAKTIADEVIVVVDYRNDDNGPEIARQMKCRVLVDNGKSHGIVFNNKNWGAKSAKNDWVMIVDADERLDAVLLKEVAAIVLGKTKVKAEIYQTSFINFEFGKFFYKADQKNKPFVRLFRKDSFKYNTKKTAEGFGIQTNSLAANNKFGKILINIPIVRTWYLNQIRNVVTLKGHLIHFSHPTIIEFILKINRYATREAKILFRNQPNISQQKIILRLVNEPIGEFIRKYLIWKFYLEGVHGFIVSVIYALYPFLKNAKYYRYVYKNNHKKEIKRMMKKYDFKDDSSLY